MGSRFAVRVVLAILASFASVSRANADVLLDANARAAELASLERATPIAVRTMAIAQVAAYDAVNSITGRFPTFASHAPSSRDASVDAAAIAAMRASLRALAPARAATSDSVFGAMLARLPDDAAKSAGIEAGERAARDVLAARGADGAFVPNDYRPRTTPGVYVPTALPVLPHWGGRAPWVLANGRALRPGPPPALDGAVWKRDLAEIRAVGRKEGSTRTPEQTAMARFWETTSPIVYWPLAREVAEARGRDASERIRILARAAVAMDDAAIAVFDAKYAYGFWRPITAIRNGGGAAGDSAWEPLIDTPMHPEYPCAHCIVSGALGAVLEDALAGAPAPPLESRSPTASEPRRWSSVEAFVSEVANARIYDGVHYRNSTEVGTAMGKQVGRLVCERFASSAR